MKHILVLLLASLLSIGCQQPTTTSPVETQFTGTFVQVNGNTTTTLALYDGHTAYWWFVEKVEGVTVNAGIPYNVLTGTTIYYVVTGTSLQLYWYTGEVKHTMPFEIEDNGNTVTNHFAKYLRQ